jgi:hypothetical protein
LTFEAESSSDVELHHLASIVGLVAHLLLHLGLVLLVLQEGQHLGVLLLEALHLQQVGLGVISHSLFLLLDLFELRLGPLSFRACLHQQ